MKPSIGGVWMLWLTLVSPCLAGTAGSHGEGVTLDEATPLEALLAAPQEHLDGVLRVDGVITEVCREHGDWLKVSGPRGGSGILVRLDEGVVVSGDAVARRVSVQGRLVAEHADDAPSGSNEPRVCPAMTRGKTRYHLRGTGLVVR